jgi:ribosome-associated translation inhibitor RaiA
MEVKVSAPGDQLDPDDVAGIERDLAKIDRRLSKYREVNADVRISRSQDTHGYHAVLELQYGRNHVQAKTDSADMRRAVREARDEVLRQINDRSRGGHSSFTKRR